MERFLAELNVNPDIISLSFGKVVKCVICHKWIDRKVAMCIRPGMDAKYACPTHHGVKRGVKP
jgi:hypothetical protein